MVCVGIGYTVYNYKFMTICAPLSLTFVSIALFKLLLASGFSWIQTHCVKILLHYVMSMYGARFERYVCVCVCMHDLMSKSKRGNVE